MNESSNQNSIFKFRTFNKQSLELLINKELWFADPATLNDPFECQTNYISVLRLLWEQYPFNTDIKNKVQCRIAEQLKNAGICSFSKTKQNQLMWAHYADEHKGFCIEFNQESLLSNNNDLTQLDIEYQSDYPHAEILQHLRTLLIDPSVINVRSEILIHQISFIIMRTKYTHWSYEKEARLIMPNSGSFCFNPKNIRSITFGLRMTEKDKQTLRGLLATDEWSHLYWYQANKSNKRFGLTFKKI